jgi:xylan 1,4-beta-xylosidase
VPERSAAARVTLTNPVIRGFAPDPSIIRVGDWYYIATSSFEWFPTIPIHRSRDLATWEYAGHVSGAVPGGNLFGSPDSGGIWAPALSHSDGKFWVAYSVVHAVNSPYLDLETFVCTAADVGGEWSPPVRVSGHGFDPSLFHDEGRHWLVNLQSDHRPDGNRFSGIVITELDSATMRTVGPTSLLLQRDTLIEGPKIFDREGWHYLVVAEGGTGTKHGALVARSRELLGPYEVDTQPLITTRDDPGNELQKCGHVELVRAPGGEWFLSHLASRPVPTEHGARNPLGRETAIQAVEWSVDGWPRMLGGGWHPSVEVSVPAVPPAAVEPEAAQTASPPGPAALGWPWSSLREDATDGWVDVTTRPGWIRLRGRQGTESLREQSFLGQRFTEKRSTVDVLVDARPTTFTQAAGLSLWYSTSSYFTLHLTWAEPAGEAQGGQQWQGGGRTVLTLTVRDLEGRRSLVRETVDASSPVFLRATVDGAVAQFWAGRSAHEVREIGPTLDFSQLSDDYGDTARFTGAFAGIGVQDLVDGAFTADFSGFDLRCRPDVVAADAGRLAETARSWAG